MLKCPKCDHEFELELVTFPSGTVTLDNVPLGDSSFYYGHGHQPEPPEGKPFDVGDKIRLKDKEGVDSGWNLTHGHYGHKLGEVYTVADIWWRTATPSPYYYLSTVEGTVTIKTSQLSSSTYGSTRAEYFELVEKKTEAEQRSHDV